MSRIKKEWRASGFLYLMSLIPIVFLLINNYYPMYGVTLAFKKFSPKLGIMGSPWVGWVQFKKLFSSRYFPIMLKNTLSLSFYYLIASFSFPIAFALMLNYLRSLRLKKTIQMVSYIPHFLSTVIICSMISIFGANNSGLFNILRSYVGLESVNFLSVPEWFNDIYVWSGVWKSTGWNAIIYVSALAGIDPSLHEAAIIDGATKLQRIKYVDLPSIKPTIVMLLILQLGQIMSIGFEKVYLLQNSLNYEASVVLSTYTYQVGLIEGDYSFSTAVGLFNTVINIILLISANTFSKKVLNESLF